MPGPKNASCGLVVVRNFVFHPPPLPSSASSFFFFSPLEDGDPGVRVEWGGVGWVTRVVVQCSRGGVGVLVQMRVDVRRRMGFARCDTRLLRDPVIDRCRAGYCNRRSAQYRVGDGWCLYSLRRAATGWWWVYGQHDLLELGGAWVID